MAEEQTPPVIDATAEAFEKRLAQLEEDRKVDAITIATLVDENHELQERVKKLEAAKPVAALRGGKADAGAIQKLGAAVYKLQAHATPVEKDESLLDL